MTTYDKYKRRKQALLIIIILFMLLVAGWSLKSIFFYNKKPIEKRIYAGIGGAVNKTGVYEISGNTKLFELIRTAEGLAKNADISKVNTDAAVTPWKVYCIPFREKTEIPKMIKKPTPKKEKIIASHKLYKRINIVYAGLPRTYLFISIVEEKNLIMITHIPWYTRATPITEYPRTLYEIYLTGGIPFLIRAIKRLMEEQIDYYFAQNRESWINFINYLGGITVKIPADFAKEYDIPVGEMNISGILSWEYISYISKEIRKEGQWLTGSEKRISLQKEFMNSMYNKFKNKNFFIQGEMIKNIINEAETNMKTRDYISIATLYKKMDNPKLKLLTFPGVLQEYNGQMMLVPSIDNYWRAQSDIYNKTIKELDKIRIDKGGFGGNE